MSWRCANGLTACLLLLTGVPIGQAASAPAEAPDPRRDVVVDGRDIGTVVFPDADLKIFLTASAEARAGRRITQRGQEADRARLEAETAALAARDHADSSRPVAPLRAADDAVPLDTTTMSFADQVRFIVELARPIFGEGWQTPDAN